MHAPEYAEAIFETVRESLLVLDHKLSILTANRSFIETFGISPQDIIGLSINELDNGQWNIPQVSRLFSSLLGDGNEAIREVECEPVFVRIGSRIVQLKAQPLRHSSSTDLILLVIPEVSCRFSQPCSVFESCTQYPRLSRELAFVLCHARPTYLSVQIHGAAYSFHCLLFLLG